MRRLLGAALLVLLPALVLGADSGAIVHLGGERYRVGSIEVDKARGRLTVAGTVLALEPGAPLEFLAGARAGGKNYESLYELDADAFEFNLACILIGLEAGGATHPQAHFDPRPVEGDRVAIDVSWEVDGAMVRRHARELLLLGGAPVPPGEWVYTGSRLLDDGRYLADLAGVLIGFVHDEDSIIQHRTGLGLNNYGAVVANPATSPPPGTRVEVSVVRMVR